MKTRTRFPYPLIAALIVPVTLRLAGAAPVVRQGGGANPAAIQALVDQFRSDLGGALNGNTATSLKTGRREINWDGVPDASAAPNLLPANFFNVTSPRGVVFNSIEHITGAALNQFMVSASAASGTPVRFGNINAAYTAIFQTFSAQRLFIAMNTDTLEVTFFLPGTKVPATVNGFGAVFADVDSATAGSRTLFRCYGSDGAQLSAASSAVANAGLSFTGISFNAGERVARVVIESGNAALSSTNNDGVGGVDVVAMDDFIYGEPQPIVVPAAGGAPKVEFTVPLKFTAITSIGVPAGFVDATLQSTPQHTYRVFSSTDLVTWVPAAIFGQPVGPNQNLFDPRDPSVYSTTTFSSVVRLSKEGRSSLFYRAVDETNGAAACTQFTVGP